MTKQDDLDAMERELEEELELILLSPPYLAEGAIGKLTRLKHAEEAFKYNIAFDDRMADPIKNEDYISDLAKDLMNKRSPVKNIIFSDKLDSIYQRFKKMDNNNPYKIDVFPSYEGHITIVLDSLVKCKLIKYTNTSIVLCDNQYCDFANCLTDIELLVYKRLMDMAYSNFNNAVEGKYD